MAQVLSVPVPQLGPLLVDESVHHELIETLPPELCGPDLLGKVWEVMMAPTHRRSHGAHFTPQLVARTVAALAIDQLDLTSCGRPQVWDPTAGGGAFLLAAARELEQRTTLSRSEVVACLHASDIDPIALEVCVASLALWSGSSVAMRTFCGDALLDLPDDWPDGFDLIVGNPPFLGQLSADTTRNPERRERLLEVYEGLASGYVDECGLFLHLALSRLSKRGVASLVLPESVLAARDARAVRELADQQSALLTLWIDDGQSFDASVDVVAPVFVATRPRSGTTSVRLGDGEVRRLDIPTDGAWAPLLGAARGVPALSRVRSDRTVADLAIVTAGFRQHFYGLSGAVREATGGADNDGFKAARAQQLRLVTSGAVEPLRLCWGMRPVKFAGASWNAPVVEVEDISDDAVRAWFNDRTIPKLLIASQTKVLEAVVDPDGWLLPSVPVLSLEPYDPDDLWLLAAVVSSPWASAWCAGRAAGSGLSHNAMRVRASELARIPLPVDAEAWTEGATAAKRSQEAATEGDRQRYQEGLRDLAESMGAAYGGVDGELNQWWWGRIRMPEHLPVTAY